MAMNSRPLLVAFLCSVILVSSALAAKDPELKQCKKQCKQQRQFDEEQKEQCKEYCEKQSKERESGGGGNNIEFWNPELQQEQTTNPYVFEDQHFTQTAVTEHGRSRVLQKFTDRSNLLRGIENYRVGTLETNPQTFLLPQHLDADVLLFVAQGRGSISFVGHDKRETFNLERGDILRVPAGTTTYGVNTDNNEKFLAIRLLVPVSIPGQYEAFHGAGGENPESFFRTFGSELLEAAFNTRRDRLFRLFGQQKQGIVVKASEEQIKALSDEAESPKGNVFNILKKRPAHENVYGRVHDVNANDYKQLQDLDLAVSYLNLTQGSMVLPFYDSKATKIAMVLKGEGYVEMVCPHLSSSPGSQGQGQGQATGRYQRVSTPLRSGMVVISPPGHPTIMVASQNQNLEVVGFYVNAKDNVKFPFVGERNIVNQFKKEAMELAFGIPAKEVEEIFKSQKEEFFSKGPQQQQPQGGHVSF